MPDPMIRFKLEGVRELRARLDSMDRKMRRSIAAKAIRAGNKVMVREIRSAAPSDTGGARRAIGGKIKTYRDSQVTVGIVGERIGARRAAKGTSGEFPPAHLHLTEYGTQPRFWTGEKATRAAMRTGLPGVGAFGQFGTTIRSAQAFVRIAAGETTGIGKRSRKLAARLDARRAATIMRAVQQGRSTGRVVAKPFFEKAFRRAVPAVQAAQRDVLAHEIEAAWRTA